MQQRLVLIFWNELRVVQPVGDQRVTAAIDRFHYSYAKKLVSSCGDHNIAAVKQPAIVFFIFYVAKMGNMPTVTLPCVLDLLPLLLLRIAGQTSDKGEMYINDGSSPQKHKQRN